jgi:hypothetical protein
VPRCREHPSEKGAPSRRSRHPPGGRRVVARYPELRFVDRHCHLAPVALAAGLFLAGGWPALLWGFFVSTAVLWHATFAINSLAHVFGRRRYPTADGSRNGLALALLTFGGREPGVVRAPRGRAGRGPHRGRLLTESRRPGAPGSRSAVRTHPSPARRPAARVTGREDGWTGSSST